MESGSSDEDEIGGEEKQWSRPATEKEEFRGEGGSVPERQPGGICEVFTATPECWQWAVAPAKGVCAMLVPKGLSALRGPPRRSGEFKRAPVQ